MPLFCFNVLLSFFLAGSIIALLTWTAEKSGSKLGGLFANLPSNILITLIFISISQGNFFVKQMVPAIPIGMLIDAIFLVVFIVLLRFSLFMAILGSLGTWLILAIIANMVTLPSLWVNILLYFIVTLFAFAYVESVLKTRSEPKSGKRYTVFQMAMRALLAGAIVGGVVLISGFVPPYLTGIVSTFPAVLFSSMVILVINQGPDFARATGKVMILSSTNIVVYALGIYYSYPVLGIVAGTVVSFLLAFLWIMLLRPLLIRIR